MNIDIKKAVKWWSKQIQSNKPHDNGDDSPASAMAMVFADMGRSHVSEEQIRIFETALEKGIKEHLEKWEYGNPSIGTDYNPDLVLASAAEAAGISALNFPFKTDMYFRDGEIWVKEGYGAKIVKI